MSIRSGADGIDILEVRTPTLAPATHTNVHLVGEGAFTVFDPASVYEDQQALLAAAVQERLDEGEQLERIVLTHHHHDHVAGALALQRRFSTPDRPIPIFAHEANIELLPEHLVIDGMWQDGATLECGGRHLTALHTPGHAPGHLVFQDRASGAVIAGDMVAGVGTILIDPRDGHLGTYLDSLERMRTLQATTLLPSHGPALPAADQVLAFYIAHRHSRTEQIRAALRSVGVASPLDLVTAVYADQVPPSAHRVAAVQITSHLIWLEEAGLARQTEAGWEAA